MQNLHTAVFRRTIRFRDHSSHTLGNGLRNVVTSVGLVAFNRQEQITGSRFAAVQGHIT